VLEADVGDPRVAPLVRDVSHVFNLAGQVSHTASMTDPVRDLELNAITHARFLEMLRPRTPRPAWCTPAPARCTGASKLPVDELTAARPIDVNGVAKLAGEHLHMVYSHAHRMSITSLRLTNVYGPRQRLTSDETRLPAGVRPQGAPGETSSSSAGASSVATCLHVDDVVDAILAATAPEPRSAPSTTSGHVRSHSLDEIAERSRSWPTPAAGGQPRRGRPIHRRIDIGSFETDSSAIRTELGWMATRVEVHGLRRTLDFYREHRGTCRRPEPARARARRHLPPARRPT
jgi:UDP-glucose 4-epimerase